jgi:hypothetical protein
MDEPSEDIVMSEAIACQRSGDVGSMAGFRRDEAKSAVMPVLVVVNDLARGCPLEEGAADDEQAVEAPRRTVPIQVLGVGVRHRGSHGLRTTPS